jgi:hypothetical protein
LTQDALARRIGVAGKAVVYQMVVSGHADQFGEGLSILSITITSTTALVA